MHTRIVFAAALHCSAALAATAGVVTGNATLRVFEDTNVYLQDEAPLASGQTQPALPWAAAASGIDATATINAKWTSPARTTLELGYAPERVNYFGRSGEDHTDHTWLAGVSATRGVWSGEAKARFLYVDGATEASVFSGLGGAPAIGGEPVRARRTQAIARSSGKLTRTLEGGFVRGVFALFDQQFHTAERATAGYCNYADRDETIAGVDGGIHVARGLSLVAGVRTGFQRQANVLGVPLNYSNTLTRWLAGVEGSPISTLKLALLAGPDVRHYGDSVRSGFVRAQRTAYAEASATWTPTAVDSFALTGKRYLWLSSAGRGAYADLLVDATWRRKLGAAWTAGAGANYHDGDTSHFNPWSPRHDHIYTATLTAGRAFAHGVRVDFDVMHDWSKSLVPNTPAREYSRWIWSAGVGRAW